MSQYRYTRPVSALERYSLVLNEVHRYHVEGVLEGKGNVDVAKLQHAVDQAAEANPAIRVRLRGFLGFSRWVDSGISPKVFALPSTDWMGQSEQGAAFMSQRLDALRGDPIADVLIVPCLDGYTRIIFRTLHAAIDGRGFLHWVAEVCRAMRGEHLLGSDSTLTDLDIQDQYKDQIEPELAMPPSACISILAPNEEERPALGYVWRRVVIDHNVPQMLPRMAAFLASWARQREAGNIGFTIPIDYRGLRTAEMGLGNLTGYVRMTVAPDETSRQLMLQLGKKIRAKADCRQFPGIRRLLWLPIRFMVRQLLPKVDAILHTVTPALPSGGLVSMGNVFQETYSFSGFNAKMLYGIPGAVGKLNVVFLNYPDFTVITFAAPTSYNHQGQLDDMIAAAQQHFSKKGSPV